MTGLLITVAVLIIFVILIKWRRSKKFYKGPKSDHFDGKLFHNKPDFRMPGFSTIFKIMMTEKRPEWKDIQAPVGVERPPARAGEDEIKITHINHSTFLIQAFGLNILTDPIWSEYASPVRWGGPKRKRPPAIGFEELPPIDIVLVSHNHYDHMDLPTLRRITYNYNIPVLAGLGNKRFLERKGVYGAVELDWWESFRVNDRITITSVPARHFSGRGLFDRNKSLWCGFVISNAKDNIYYSGDTAYDSFTREIGNRFDPLVLSILPIGAFKPEWFMKYVHASPDEAVQMHLDLGSHKSIATHFGTFPMAWEGMDEPVKRLREVLAERKLPVDDFIIPEAGKTYTIQ